MYCKIRANLNHSVPFRAILYKFMWCIRPNHLFAFIIMTGVCLVACQPSSTRDSVRKSDLVGSRWALTELMFEDEPLDLTPFDPISLEFRQELIGGETACGNYRMGWQLGRDGQVRSSGALSETRRGCLDEAAEISNAYTAVLEQMHTLVLDNSTLIIDGRNGKLIFEDAK